MNIIIGVTGSVAAVLLPKIYKSIKSFNGVEHNIKVVLTDNAIPFVRYCGFDGMDYDKEVVYDADEWKWQDQNGTRNTYKKDDEVLHIQLKDWADAIVIAPLSANTLAKITNGLCDNLLTSVVRAWDYKKPMILAPAMNTQMWDSVFTRMQINIMKDLKATIVPPQSKMLACGTEGMGAMANISEISKTLRKVFSKNG